MEASFAKDDILNLFRERDLAFFAENILDMEIVGHHKSWSDHIARDKRIAINAARDHGKSYFFSFAYVIWRLYHGWIPILPSSCFKSIPRQSLGYIFSSSQDNAVKFLEMVRNEIETNPKLHFLIPAKKDTWSKMEIRCSNGATVRARGWGSAVRGGHPGWVVLDDVLGDENLYSEIQRQKQVEYFYSAVTPMVIPGGQLLVIGCVRPDTYILTRNGIEKIGEIIPVNDFSKQRVIELDRDIYGAIGFDKASHYWVNGKCKTKRITTTYGLEIEGSYRHPIRVQEGKSPRKRKLLVWRRLDELKIKDLVRVEICQNIYGNKFDNCDLAYFMGLWTAEGSSEKCGRLSICSSEPDVLKYLKSNPLGFKFLRHQNKSRVQNKLFYDYLKCLGVDFVRAENKIVPKVIFSASKRAQQAFIRGFADGDGCSYKNSSLQQINFSSASKELILGLRVLLMNMGMMPSYMIKKPGVSKKVKGKFPSHQLVLSAGYAYKFMQEIGFSVERKNKEFDELPAPQSFFVGIKRIEDSECETVDFVIPNSHTFWSNGFISHNTPFHSEDLYADLAKNEEYKFYRYPAFKEATGEALWPTRYSKAMLEKKKKEIGSTRFTREYLCVPVADTNSLFPDRIVKENYREDLELVTDMTNSLRSEYDLYVGVDLALSATIGADYTVITTIGIDKFKNRRLFDIRRFKGRSMTEQLLEIESVYRIYRPNKIFIEDNQFQKVFADELVKRTDMPVEGFTTTASAKHSLERGVPSLQILFENKKFLIPRKTERDRRITNELVHELRCFTYVNGKLQGLGAHDDMVMSLWIANEAANTDSFNFSFV